MTKKPSDQNTLMVNKRVFLSSMKALAEMNNELSDKYIRIAQKNNPKTAKILSEIESRMVIINVIYDGFLASIENNYFPSLKNDKLV